MVQIHADGGQRSTTASLFCRYFQTDNLVSLLPSVAGGGAASEDKGVLRILPLISSSWGTL